LLARDLARTDAEGKLEINPVVRMCTRTMLNPQVSFGLTTIEADGASRVAFFNGVPGFAIGTWVDANQIRSFELIDDPRAIADRIRVHAGVSAPTTAEAARAPKTYTLNAAALPALPVDRAQKVDGLASALAQGGLPPADAAALERAFASATPRAVLVGANRAAGGDGVANTQTLSWISNTGALWTMTQSAGANALTITSSDAAGLAPVLAGFVNTLLSAMR
jgi:hypothetical protein